MGAYLDVPQTDKKPIDESSDILEYGASSMQGWRTSQEDEHNCCLKFDTNTSFFAVYDGHGGAEVAQYTAKHFPDFIRELQLYKDGKFSEALEQAFLDFDATLREEKVQETLKALAGLETDEEDEEEKEHEAAKLFEEADMPLDQLMQRYRSRAGGSVPGVSAKLKLKKDKSQSPMIRSKKDVPLSTRPDPESGDIKFENKLVNGHNDLKSNSMPDSSASEAKPAAITHDERNDTGSCSSAMSASSSKDNASTGSPSKSEASQSTPSSQTTVSQSQSKVEEVSCSSNDTSGTAKSSGTPQEQDGVVGSSATTSSSVVTSSVGADSSSVTPTQEAASSASSSQGEPCSSSGSPKKSQGGSGDIEDESFDEDEETSEEEEHSDDEVDTGKVKWWNFGEGDDDDDTDSEEDDDEEEDEDGEGPFEDEDDDEECQEVITGGEEPGFDSGCTAVVTMLRGRELYVANAGDSRCVLCRGGKSVDLSEDHKPEDTIEKTRIIKAGGRITADGRVNGGLNLSRALGDHRYKLNETVAAREQMITALPDIRVTTLQEDDEFMIVACDGIWNAMSSQDVVTFVRDRIQAGIRPISAIAGEMFELCLAPNTKGDGTGCDNMTCIIVNFKPTPTGTSEADPKLSCAQTTTVKAPDSDVTVDSTVCSKRKAENVVDVDTSANKKTRVDGAQIDEADSSG